MDKTPRARPKPLEGDDKTRISFVDMGRAIAALLVVYSHIAHPWVQVKGENAPVIGFFETFSSEPMRMATQGIGQVAVPFFFLVSGFIVTPIAIRQGYRRFALNRFIRVYAPLLFVLLLTSAALWAGLEPQSTGQSQELTPWTMFTNWTLVNYVLYPQIVLMPVAWTMIIEVLFYLILLALLPVLRRAVWLAIGIELTFVFVVLSSRSELNETWSLFAVNVSYLPILIIGQIIWATTSKKIPLWAGSAFGALAWMLYVYADIIDVGRIDDSYNLAMSIAVMFFMMGYFAEPKLRQFRFWTAMSERSYSIYLLHGLGIFVTLGLLRPTVPFAIALPISLLVTAALVEVSYRGVERPSHELARSLSRRVGNAPVRRSGAASDRAGDTGGRDAGGAGAGAGATLAGPDHPDGPRPAGRDVRTGGADTETHRDAGVGESTARFRVGQDSAGAAPSQPPEPRPPERHREAMRSESWPPPAAPRPVPERQSDGGRGDIDSRVDAGGDPVNFRGDRPRPRPDRAEPPVDQRGDLHAHRSAPPPPDRYRQPPGRGADPRHEPRRTPNPTGAHSAEHPERPMHQERPMHPERPTHQEHSAAEPAGPKQARRRRQRRPDERSQQRQPDAESQRASPRQESQLPLPEWPPQRPVPPRRAGGNDGPPRAR